MMKFKNIFALIAVVLFATACQDDDLVSVPSNKPAAIGDEIVFGGRAGFENGNSDSRTVYSGVTYTVEQENGTVLKFERIDWTEGDKIEIYSPDAANGPTSHYQISNWESGNEDTKSDYSYLTREDNSSLQWGKGIDNEGTHRFYAMYPSSKMFDPNSESNVAKGVMMDRSVVKGIVPIEQSPISVETTTVDGVAHYEAKPNMNFAYMVAKSRAKRVDGSVNLSFVPIVTAVKVTLTLPKTTTNGDITSTPQTVNISNIRVEGDGIAGSFSANLDETKWTGTYPTCVNSPEATDVISLKLWQTVVEDGTEKQKPLSVKAGGQLTFTVFLLPGADINSLKISFSPGSGWVGKTLSGDKLFPANKKTVINGLQLPVVGFTPSYGNWMSQLEETTPLARLSIPGAGSAFSKDGGSGYQAQTLSFEQLWATGIRAFEIITDRQKGSDFGSESIRCNNTPVTGWSVKTVMDEVVNKLTGSSECAVLIFTYQPVGDNSYPRESATYVSNLCSYFSTNYTDYLIKYSPELTLKDAQGKIIIIVRPSQIDEDTEDERKAALDAVSSSDVNDKILIVDGCGTSKDKWRTRGYKYNGNVSPEQGKFTGIFGWGSWATGNMENAVTNQSNWSNVTQNTDREFAYDINDDGYQIWYQEWARVVPESNGNQLDDNITKFGSYYWRDSYNEKLSDVKKAFDMALSNQYSGDEGSIGGPYVFINTLSGFYVSTSFTLSSKPLDPSTWGVDGDFFNGGSQGDIASLAQDLNEAFYQYVLLKKDQTGATGIVMMDFVANQLLPNAENPTNEGSYYLPGVIINNNYHFNTVKVPEPPKVDDKPTDDEEDA